MFQPDYPRAMGLLTHLNSDELKELLNDEDKFETVLKDIKEFKDWETEKEMLIASNRSLAEYNLSQEPELTEAKQKIAEQSGRGEELCKSVQEKLDELRSKSGGVSLDTTLALLETAAAQMEEESEAIAKQFLAGEVDIEKFLEDFSKARTVMHLRKVKVDKMNELIRNKHQPSQGNPYINNRPAAGYPGYPSPAHGYGYPPTSVPYPMGPLNMPMPGAYRNHF